MKKTLHYTAALFLTLGVGTLKAQTYNDGAMYLEMWTGYHWVETYDDISGNDEYNFIWYGADNANVDALGWRPANPPQTGVLVWVDYAGAGWVSSQNAMIFSHTFGTAGNTPQTVPQYLQLYGEGWEDDCFSCSSSGFICFGGACGGGASDRYSYQSSCCTSVCSGCSEDDQYCSTTISSTIDYRIIPPCSPVDNLVPPSAWVGDWFSTGCGSDDIGAELQVYYTPPIPNSLTASPTSLCGAGNVTLNFGGAVYGGLYDIYNVNTGIWDYNVAGPSRTYFISTTTTYRVYTKNGTCQSLSYRDITVPVNPIVTPLMTITTPSTTVCNGTAVNFSSSTIGGGPGPVYEWYVNGVPQSNNSTTFSTSSLTNGAVVSATVTSNALCAIPPTMPSNSLVMTVSPVVVPSVTASTPNTTICAGDNAVFTATPTNGGTNPSYQWYVNGLPAGTNAPVFSTTSLTSGATVNVQLTSNNQCATPTTAASTNITMTVNPVLVPAMLISSSATTICAGTPVNFTSTVTNGGAGPVYDWYINGVAQGNNSPTFSSSTLTNGDIVTASLVSNATCVSPNSINSNGIPITVNPLVTPTLGISTTSTTLCAGENAVFTAAATNGGSNPTYQWFVNGSPAGTNSAVFTSGSLASGDVVTAQLTSSEACASPTTVNATGITMTVNLVVNPSAFITTAVTSICAGDPVTVNATVTNGGGSPTYDWVLNGVSTGSTGSSYTSSALADGDILTLVYTSSDVCAVPGSVASNSLAFQVTPVSAASVSIASSNGILCEGQPITFVASTVNAGATPTYQWTVNGSTVGANNPVFTSPSLIAGDVVMVNITSANPCSSNPTAASNNLVIVPSPTVSAGVDVTIQEGQSIQLNATSSLTSTYTWTPSGTLDNPNIQSPVASPVSTTEYTVIAMTTDGCYAEDKVVVIVQQNVVIYTSFTPNGDGVNDTWIIDFINGYPTCTVEIFNRWGNQVFRSTGYSQPWDGTYNGEALPLGTYYYIIDLNNGKGPMQGTVTILK